MLGIVYQRQQRIDTWSESVYQWRPIPDRRRPVVHSSADGLQWNRVIPDPLFTVRWNPWVFQSVFPSQVLRSDLSDNNLTHSTKHVPGNLQRSYSQGLPLASSIASCCIRRSCRLHNALLWCDRIPGFPVFFSRNVRFHPPRLPFHLTRACTSLMHPLWPCVLEQSRAASKRIIVGR